MCSVFTKKLVKDEARMATQNRQISRVSDGLVEADAYEERHRPGHQEQVGQGYPINPVLRDNFVSTPNDHRDALELADWWGLPYIESRTWQETESRLRAGHQALDPGLSEEDAEARIEADRTAFFAFNPEGTKFTVLCLDGGAWDRPSKWGVYPTLEDAIECCERGPAWRRAHTRPVEQTPSS